MKQWIFAAAYVFSIFASPLTLANGPLTYSVDGEDYEGYFLNAKNVADDQKAPLVLLIHDWDGLTAYEEKRAHMLAEMGYAVMAADLFGKGVRPTEVKDKKQHTGELYQDREKMRKLMLGALNEAGQQGADLGKAVVMGYCFGGAAALELARSGHKMKGFASFHGGLSSPEGQNYQNTSGKVIIFHGTADSMISMNDVATLANSLEAEQVPHEIISYGGAPHSFTVFDSPAYRQAADEQSWSRFSSFLKSITQ